MKQIVLILFLCIVGCSFVWGQDANYYRNPDRIYPDSKDGHQGAFLWKMKKSRRCYSLCGSRVEARI